MTKDFKPKIRLAALFLVALLFFAFNSGGDKNLRKGSNITQGDAYRFHVNRLDIPLNSRGVLANVDFGGISEGQYDGKGFLFSGGFMMSGKNGAIVWSNAVASASRIEDYLPGVVGGTEDDPRAHIYALKATDPPFGDSWQEWRDAVDLGAYFYDGDGDGVYDPVDKNGNGQWDPDEDKPDILGDETVWCVYNDALPSNQRGFQNVEPMGIEIRQTIWGFATSGDLGNIVFVRYSVNNAGTVAEEFDSVYFGVWDDPDLGGGDGYTDDLVGSDPSLNAGFTYNDGPDDAFGVDPPCFLVDFFQGPWEETGDPNDMAFNTKGPTLGIDTIMGAVNLPLTSFVHYMQSHPRRGDPDDEFQARNYLLGLDQQGNLLDPCNDDFGDILGDVDCSTIDPRFWYSGDPVSLTGWINNTPTDQRQMLNTGPFTLKKDKPVDIIVAYVVGRSTSALTSVVKAKQIDRAAQFTFDNNFNFPPPPPKVEPIIKTTDNSIELIWETSPQVTYHEIGRGFDMRFEHYQVYMHQTNSVSEKEGGRTNTVLIGSFDIANEINNVIFEDPVSLERQLIYSKGEQLDSAIYADPNTGRVRLVITTDPFTQGSLIKGKPYFISIVPTAYNYDEIIQLDALGNFLIPKEAAVGMIAGIPQILNDGIGRVGITPGINTLTPFKTGQSALHIAGGSDAEVTYDVIDKSKITGDTYEVSFFIDSAATTYDLYYRVTDIDNGNVEIDSSKNYILGPITDLAGGASVNVEWLTPGVSNVEYNAAWVDPVAVPNKVGIFYMGKDVEDTMGVVSLISTQKSKVTRVPDAKRVELRFGATSTAYRYINNRGFSSYKFAGDSGLVEVPFQAWVKDDKLGLEYQLAVGFIETADSGGSLNSSYDPGLDITLSKEYIIIFNSPYDPTGNQYEFTGNDSRWANLTNGFTLLQSDPRYNDSIAVIAKSPWFNALYVAGLQRIGDPNAPLDGQVNININYPLTPDDRYQFTVESDLTADEERALFEKVNVFPNPLFAYNPATTYTGGNTDEPYVTFSNLPSEVTIKIYSLSGNLVRTLNKNDTSPYLTWDLKNESSLRVASGMYIAIVSNPRLGQKVLKFAIIQPQKQIKRF